MSSPCPDLSDCEYSRLSRSRIEGYLDSGQWHRVRLDDYLRRSELEHPDAIASIDFGESASRSMTYSEYADLAWRVAAGLRALGVGRGDVVTVMLPNCSEFGATIFAISSLGAAYSGIPVAYGQREATHMLTETDSNVLIAPGANDRRDFEALAGQLLASCPALEHVVLLGGNATTNPAMMDFRRLVDVAPLPPTPPGPAGALAHVGFTSGTTSLPKGVLNSHESLDSTIRNWVEHIGEPQLDADIVNLIASPIGHHAGFVWGVLMTAYLGGTAVHLDRWDPTLAAELVQRHRVTAFLGAPAFLVDLLGVDAAPATWESLRILTVAGSPVPRPLIARARRRFDAFICPAWGMTELGIGISVKPGSPGRLVESTDGLPVRGCEVRVVDSEGSPCRLRGEGDLQIRGPSLFAGYLGRPSFVSRLRENEGWFDTGDRAFVDADGYLTLSGRTKDLIIRGGENIPVTLVENVLFGHPGIREVAIVGIADDRLGERACACVVTTGETRVDLEELKRFLAEAGVSKHFWPERFREFTRLPRTPSGKVKKSELRHEFDN
jgi:cyclohexanecarboxylate-CoA ligase